MVRAMSNWQGVGKVGVGVVVVQCGKGVCVCVQSSKGNGTKVWGGGKVKGCVWAGVRRHRLALNMRVRPNRIATAMRCCAVRAVRYAAASVLSELRVVRRPVCGAQERRMKSAK